jgi:hypothetical protein
MWVHGECVGEGEQWCNSLSKQGGDEAAEMGSDGSFSSDGGALRWSAAAEEGS